MDIANISEQGVETINSMQDELKTKEGKDVVLVAYEK